MKIDSLRLGWFFSLILLVYACDDVQRPVPSPDPDPYEGMVLSLEGLTQKPVYEDLELSVPLDLKEFPEGARYGFAYSTKGMPTVLDSIVQGTLREGIMHATLTDLQPETLYYIRLYVQVANDKYAYSKEFSYKPPSKADIPSVLVKGGSFMMGSPDEPASDYPDWHVWWDECPKHEVHVKSFRIDIKEVTYGKYCEFLNAKLKDPQGLTIDLTDPKQLIRWIYTGKYGDRSCGIQYDEEKSAFYVKEGCHDLPAGWIRYPGAEAYAKWVGGRLPSESEFEYAALGGQLSKGYRFAGSNNIEEVAWYEKNSIGTVHPVGSKLPNELGLYDMSGNVGEWCQDSYHLEEVGYKGHPNDGSAWTEGGRGHIIRGGSFQSELWDCRSKYRTYNAWYYCGHNVGFRVVYDVAP